MVRRALQAADRDPRWLAVSLIAAVAATYLQPAPLPLWLFGALLLPCFWRWPGR